MTLAEALQRDADLAKREGGMYYSGEYLQGYAMLANGLEAENAKLRELVRISIEYCNSGTCDECPIQGEDGSCSYADMARELEIEVN